MVNLQVLFDDLILKTQNYNKPKLLLVASI